MPLLHSCTQRKIKKQLQKMHIPVS